MAIDYHEIWKRRSRQAKDPVNLSFDRYTIDDKPVCMAWSGDGGYDRMACFFLTVSHFGSKYQCMYCDKGIHADKVGTLYPLGECPLWGKGG